MRKTKIVCTIGPSCDSPSMIRKLTEAGMDIARLNFAHGELAEHAQKIREIRKVSGELGKSVAIMLDIKGPEIRTGKLKRESYTLVEGDRLILTTIDVIGDEQRISVNYPMLPHDLHIGSPILMDDGLIELRVEVINGPEIYCRIVNGGKIKSRKGVNVPGVKVNLPGVTERDVEHIMFGIEHGIDIIAASFVRKAADIIQIRDLLQRHGAPHIQIIAKIENEEGVQNLDHIIAVSDGIMVARGDLGVEIPVENVPLVQKQMIRKCNTAGKPVITATHMLDSMQYNPRPTRAEASDVANAIMDGTDAVMLSGETAAGKYPIASVQMMARIAERVETFMIAGKGDN
jgi:pyruvate kinase